MKHKNNWSHKNDFKKQRIIEKSLKGTEVEKPSVNDKGVMWGARK